MSILSNIKNDFEKKLFSNDYLIIIESLGIVTFELIESNDEAFEFYDVLNIIVTNINEIGLENDIK
jgi:hypothetical protein